MEQVNAGEMPPMESLGLGISIEVHEVIHPISEECAVGVAGNSQIIGDSKMISRPISVR
jgi:hypothetical protein